MGPNIEDRASLRMDLANLIRFVPGRSPSDPFPHPMDGIAAPHEASSSLSAVLPELVSNANVASGHQRTVRRGSGIKRLREKPRSPKQQATMKLAHYRDKVAHDCRPLAFQVFQYTRTQGRELPKSQRPQLSTAVFFLGMVRGEDWGSPNREPQECGRNMVRIQLPASVYSHDVPSILGVPCLGSHFSPCK